MVMKWAVYVAVLCSTAAYAQSGAPTLPMDRTSFAAAHEYVAADAVPKQLSLPRNLIVSSEYRAVVEKMLLQSPTFRRQCVRIGAEPRLTVHLRLGGIARRTEIRATTQVTRAGGGGITAVIEILPLNDDVELIAHEIEHVIEQLDDVDLASYAARGGTGVRLLSENVFETSRAKRTGIRVTDEVRLFSQKR